MEWTSRALDGHHFHAELTCSRLKCELPLQLLRTFSRTNGMENLLPGALENPPYGRWRRIDWRPYCQPVEMETYGTDGQMESHVFEIWI